MNLVIGESYLVNYHSEYEPELSYYGKVVIVNIREQNCSLSGDTEYVCETVDESNSIFYEEDFVCPWNEVNHYEADVTIKFSLPRDMNHDMAASIVQDSTMFDIVMVSASRQVEEE